MRPAASSLPAGRDVLLEAVVLDHLPDEGAVRPLARGVPGDDAGEVGGQAVGAVLAAVLLAALHQMVEVGDDVRRGGGRPGDPPLLHAPLLEPIPSGVAADPGVPRATLLGPALADGGR